MTTTADAKSALRHGANQLCGSAPIHTAPPIAMAR